jgi:hypothetical protein
MERGRNYRQLVECSYRKRVEEQQTIHKYQLGTPLPTQADTL